MRGKLVRPAVHTSENEAIMRFGRVDNQRDATYRACIVPREIVANGVCLVARYSKAIRERLVAYYRARSCDITRSAKSSSSRSRRNNRTVQLPRI